MAALTDMSEIPELAPVNSHSTEANIQDTLAKFHSADQKPKQRHAVGRADQV
jgi:hypothetical protein